MLTAARKQPSIIRLGILLLLFDVYLTWARIEKATTPTAASTLPSPAPLPSPSLSSPIPTSTGALNTSIRASTSSNDTSSGNGGGGAPFSAFLATQPIIMQYLFFLSLCFSETAAFHLPIRWLLGLFPPTPPPPSHHQTSSASSSPGPPPSSRSTTTTNNNNPRQPSPAASSISARHSSNPPPSLPSPLIPYYPHPSVISTALLVSSFTKLFPLLLLIWSYDLPSSASAVSWAVIVNNVAALEILLDCGLLRAGLLAAFGAVCRGLVGWAVLGAVGVEGGVAAAGVVETGDLVDLGRRAAGWLAGVG